MRRLVFFALVLVFCLAPVLRADDHAAPATPVTFNDHGDPILRAMVAELRRSQEKLQLGQLQRPYYIDYEVSEIQDYVIDATLGSVRNDQTNIVRAVRVVVRIGDYKQDSYFGEGTGAVDTMPLDNDEMALRHQLWLVTDRAYKAALSGLTEKQADLKNVVVETDLPDFSRERPAESVTDLSRLGTNLGQWKELVRSTSNLFRADPDLESSEALLHFRVLNRYFVNTEGTVTRRGNTTYSYFFDGSGQAADGMRLERSHGYIVGKAEELPKPEQVRKDAQQLIGTFAALRKAPLVEDNYHGPVLFSADAATALIERLVAPNILGVRPDPGSPARTRGEFAAYYKNRVLPDFLTVVDDPRPRTIEGVTLLGSYNVDDEGVKADPITVIDKGVLVNYLQGREPIKDSLQSNGRGRAVLTGAPRPQISNLIVEAANGQTLEELKKKLVQMCKDQGRPYGYFVETTGVRLAPRLLWRIYTSDGHMELVRGAVFNQLDIRTLRTDLIAAGNDAYVYNRTEPLPSAIVAPSLLFDELEIQRANRTREKPPQYPAPPLNPLK
jgi:hypothetical protein